MEVCEDLMRRKTSVYCLKEVRSKTLCARLLNARKNRLSMVKVEKLGWSENDGE